MAVIGILLAGAARAATAQSPGHATTQDPPPWRIGAYVGAAEHSHDGPIPGSTPDREHRFLGVQAATTVLEVGRLSLAYAPGAVPLMLITNNPTYAIVTRRVNGKRVSAREEIGRQVVLGTAIVPFGVELDLALHRAWHAYGSSAVGGVWFTRDVPVLDSRSFNVTFEMATGLSYEYRVGRWIQTGYKFHHLSNAGTGKENPGLNADLFYVGWQRRFGGRP